MFPKTLPKTVMRKNKIAYAQGKEPEVAAELPASFSGKYN